MSVAPIELPGFGDTFSWITCRNTMCANFGICYEGRDPGQKSVSKKHFTLSAIDAKAVFVPLAGYASSPFTSWPIGRFEL